MTAQGILSTPLSFMEIALRTQYQRLIEAYSLPPGSLVHFPSKCDYRLLPPQQESPMKSLNEQIEVMQAVANGKKIEFRHLSESGYIPAGNIKAFNWAYYDQEHSMTQAEREKIRHRIDVMQAYLDGKPIQMKWGNRWRNLSGDGLKLDFNEYEYRIKPEPAVVYLNEYPPNHMVNGFGGFYQAAAHLTAEDARTSALQGVVRKAVKFIEAPDQE